jgi:hypothetical protein
MLKIGIKGIIPKRNLSKNKKPLYKYPYLGVVSANRRNFRGGHYSINSYG